jgi:hypothetical protein
MTECDCSPYRDEILRRFIEGSPMSAAARTHYVGCVACIMAVSEQLDTNGSASRDTADGEAIRAAIERGRRVLEREFGIPTPRPVNSK